MAPAGAADPHDERDLGRLLGLAADIADAPIAALSLRDGARAWLKGCHRLPGIVEFTQPSGACPRAIEPDGAVIVHDASADPVRCTHALVTAEAGIRFYAAVPLLDAAGESLGWLSVADRLPRTAFAQRSRARLRRLARIAAELLEAEPGRPSGDNAHGFLDATQFALLISDALGTITLANPACERLLGYEPGTMRGLNVRAIVPARFHALHTAGMAAMVADGTPRLAGKSVEVTAVRKDGSELPIELSLSSWRNRTGLAVGAVNLFAAQLRAGTLDAMVGEALERHGLAPSDIEVEVTETVALHPDDDMLRPLRSLHGSAVGIAFDDFGTGFASLSTLKSFPLTKLKIDRSFVRDILTDPFDAAIVKGMLDIGSSLDLDVIAEGIETVEQEAALLDMGCRRAQGFRYGKALEPRAFALRLAADAGLTAAPENPALRQAS